MQIPRNAVPLRIFVIAVFDREETIDAFPAVPEGTTDGGLIARETVQALVYGGADIQPAPAG